MLVPQVPEGYVMLSASMGQGSRSRLLPGVTASRPASHSTSSDVTLDAIAKVLDDKISPLQVSLNALTSQFGNLQIELQESIHATMRVLQQLKLR